MDAGDLPRPPQPEPQPPKPEYNQTTFKNWIENSWSTNPYFVSRYEVPPTDKFLFVYENPASDTPPVTGPASVHREYYSPDNTSSVLNFVRHSSAQFNQREDRSWELVGVGKEDMPGRFIHLTSLDDGGTMIVTFQLADRFLSVNYRGGNLSYIDYSTPLLNPESATQEDYWELSNKLADLEPWKYTDPNGEVYESLPAVESIVMPTKHGMVTITKESDDFYRMVVVENLKDERGEYEKREVYLIPKHAKTPELASRELLKDPFGAHPREDTSWVATDLLEQIGIKREFDDDEFAKFERK